MLNECVKCLLCLCQCVGIRLNTLWHFCCQFRPNMATNFYFSSALLCSLNSHAHSIKMLDTNSVHACLRASYLLVSGRQSKYISLASQRLVKFSIHEFLLLSRNYEHRTANDIAVKQTNWGLNWKCVDGKASSEQWMNWMLWKMPHSLLYICA